MIFTIVNILLLMIIGFGELSWYLLFPLFIPGLSYLRTYVETKMPEDNGFDLPNHPFIMTFLMLLGESLSGFLELILYFNQRREKTDTDSSDLIVNLKKNYIQPFDPMAKTHFITLKLLLRVLLIISLDICAKMTFTIMTGKDKDCITLESKITNMQILIIAFISYFILKQKLFIHQIVSVVLIVIGTLLLSYDIFKSVHHWEHLGYIFLCYLMWDTQEVTEKWTMERLNVSPYKLLFLNGVIGSILFILLFIPLAYIPCDLSFCDNGVVEQFFVSMGKVFASAKIALLAFAYLILSFIYNLFLMITKKVYSPNHKSTFEAFTYFLVWIFELITGKKKIEYDFSMILIGFIIIVIGVLIFNEIIICYFLGLNQNTKQSIIRRNITERKMNYLELEHYINNAIDENIINFH